MRMVSNEDDNGNMIECILWPINVAGKKHFTVTGMILHTDRPLIVRMSKIDG